MSHQDLDIEAIRRHLSHLKGAAYWRSLQEVADDEAFQEWVQREFPQGARELRHPLSRRRFLQLAAASLGLAGLTACVGQPPEDILPYVEQPPEELVPGEPLFFATAHLLGGYACGMLAESHMGRPTKLEGNPDHPASRGGSDVYAQASILSLYDPDRSQTVTTPQRRGTRGRIRTWEDFLAVLQAQMGEQRAQQGAGIRLLTPTLTSPTLVGQIEQLLQAFPQARWHQYEPVNWDNAYAGMEMVFGRRLQARYDFSQADVILSLDADFLGSFPGRLRYTRDFTARRTVDEEASGMNRLYALASTPTLTSGMADHSWPSRPEQIEALARRLAQRLGLSVPADDGVRLPPALEESLDALVADLQENAGRCLVLAGMTQPPAVHALAQAINVILENDRQTVSYSEPVQPNTENQTESLRTLAGEMAEGAVDVLLIVGGNPVYATPADLDFAGALEQVGFSVHLSLYEDETSRFCDWHVPQTHFLEGWGDARAYDGTATLLQPLIEPLYANRSPHELLAATLRSETRDPYEIVRNFWQERLGADDPQFERLWRRALRDGFMPDTRLPSLDVSLPEALDLPQPALPAGDRVLVFRPDPSLWDGRYSNNGWLQELPKPFTKLTWDNAALVDPGLAQSLDLNNGDVITLRLGQRQVQATAFILPGQAAGCVTLHLGYGRQAAGRVGDGAGFNAYFLRSTEAPWLARNLEIERTGATYPLATTQSHHTMAGRDLVRVATLAHFGQDPQFAQESEADLPSLYPEREYEGYAWGMSINLNTCIGCNACVIACQAENNIPVVGKEGVRRGREMHWIRVDGYFQGTDLEAPRTYNQPVPCMHCETAPCEPVCPVAATTHSAEGLNEMTYNRCVGTRYCSNNCPYKVRRFNFLDYTQEAPVLELLQNPDVTVRSRGVMEKCTYCVQRINRARATAAQEGRDIRDGEIMTACQQACPAQAITFGDISDPETEVARRKAQPRDYGLLAEIGTRPRTTYLAKVVNVNQEIGDERLEAGD